MSIVRFPIPDATAMHRTESVRQIARRAGWDVRRTEREFIAAGCSQDALNQLSERRRQQRMTNNNGPEAA